MPLRPITLIIATMAITFTPQTDRPWLDADDVAPLLCTTAHTLRRLAREGRCPVLVRRIGGRWWFSRLDLMRFLDGVIDEPTS